MAKVLNHQVFTHKNFDASFIQDVNAANGSIILQSPYITANRVLRIRDALADAVRRNVSVCVYVRSPETWNSEERVKFDTAKLDNAIGLLRSHGIHVNIRAKAHEKLIFIDDRIFWDGSLNPLSYLDTSERMNRWVSYEMVVEALVTHNLMTCESCTSQLGLGRLGELLDPANEINLLGQAIQQRRKSLGWSQEKLAKLANVAPYIVVRIEAGRHDPRLSTLVKILHAMQLSLLTAPWWLQRSVHRVLRKLE